MKYLFILLMLFSTNMYSRVKLKIFSLDTGFRFNERVAEVTKFVETNNVISVDTAATRDLVIFSIMYE